VIERKNTQRLIDDLYNRPRSRRTGRIMRVLFNEELGAVLQVKKSHTSK
jgi:phosphoribosylformylglycinamidine synthase